MRLREAEAEAEDQHREISEFQAELVQLGAALNGDHTTEAYGSGKLGEGMTVAEASEYCRGAFARFREECRRCHEGGMDESHVPTLQAPPTATAVPSASSNL